MIDKLNYLREWTTIQPSVHLHVHLHVLQIAVQEVQHDVVLVPPDAVAVRVVHLLVEVGPALAQLQLVLHVGVLAEVVVDPVCEGCLLLK